MLESLINKDNSVRKELLDMILETNNSILTEKYNFLLNNLIKIKSVDIFISGIILLNKNNYFGTYSLDFNRDIIQSCIERNDDSFLKIFTNPQNSIIFKKNDSIDKLILNEIKRFYEIEKLVYFYLYQKKYYNCFYEVNLQKIQELKKEIYKIKNIDIGVKYFSNKNTISIKKGNEIITSDIVEVIFKIFEDVKINYKLDNFVRSNYKTEYYFIKDYLENSTL
tara:strand:+ start:169 stop:837 length:669 start_codon:yes stop_codon:yes gene_type:complete